MAHAWGVKNQVVTRHDGMCVGDIGVARNSGELTVHSRVRKSGCYDHLALPLIFIDGGSSVIPKSPTGIAGSLLGASSVSVISDIEIPASPTADDVIKKL